MKWTWRNPRAEKIRRLMDRLAFHQGSVSPRLRFTRSLWEPDFGQPYPERLAVQAIQKKTAQPVVTAKAA